MAEERIRLLQGTRPTLGGSIVGVVSVRGEPADRVRLWITPDPSGETDDITVPFGEPVDLEDGSELIIDGIETPGGERRGPALAARIIAPEAASS